MLENTGGERSVEEQINSRLFGEFISEFMGSVQSTSRRDILLEVGRELLRDTELLEKDLEFALEKKLAVARILHGCKVGGFRVLMIIGAALAIIAAFFAVYAAMLAWDKSLASDFLNFPLRLVG